MSFGLPETACPTICDGLMVRLSCSRNSLSMLVISKSTPSFVDKASDQSFERSGSRSVSTMRSSENDGQTQDSFRFLLNLKLNYLIFCKF